MFVETQTGKEVEERIAKEKSILPGSSEDGQNIIADALCAYIDRCWTEAQEAKRDIADQILKNQRQWDGEYDPEKLYAIQQMKSAEVYTMITNVKCRSAVAWLRESLLPPFSRPWALESTPVPELPLGVMEQVRDEVMMSFFRDISTQAQASGMALNVPLLMLHSKQMAPALYSMADQLIVDRARDAVERAEREIDDDLIEGGYYQALHECIPDIVMKTGIVKGPIKRKEKITGAKVNPETGRAETKVEERVIEKYYRRPPMDIYPSPDSVEVDDGYLIDRETMKPGDLFDLIGLPGYKEREIRSVLQEYSRGRFRLQISTDSDAAEAEGRLGEDLSSSENLDALNFWGAVQGRVLLEWDREREVFSEDSIDEDRFYEIEAWKIGNHVIKAVQNPDPMGRKPYRKASFAELQDAFFGMGLPELIADSQQICNASSRAIVNNLGIASGPQVEIDMSRLEDGQSTDVWPWKKWLTKNPALLSSPAVRFNYPTLVAGELLGIYKHFSAVADEHSIPAYAHGDPKGGGALSTASGFSMAYGGAGRNVKDVMRSIDIRMIEPAVRERYEKHLAKLVAIMTIVDIKVVAKGSASLMAKEQQVVRRIEFLNLTNNPTDLQIMGIDGRRTLLVETAKALDIDHRRIFPKPNPMEKALPPGPQPPPAQAGAGAGLARGPSPASLDVAGNRAGGAESRQITNFGGR